MTPSIQNLVERLRIEVAFEPTQWTKNMYEAAALIERLAGALEPFANAGSMEIKGNGMVNVLLFIEDIERARAALSGEPTP